MCQPTVSPTITLTTNLSHEPRCKHDLYVFLKSCSTPGQPAGGHRTSRMMGFTMCSHAENCCFKPTLCKTVISTHDDIMVSTSGTPPLGSDLSPSLLLPPPLFPQLTSDSGFCCDICWRPSCRTCVCVGAVACCSEATWCWRSMSNSCWSS